MDNSFTQFCYDKKGENGGSMLIVCEIKTIIFFFNVDKTVPGKMKN